MVIKYGGAAMLDEGLRDDFAADVVLLKYVGLNPIVVHGGGPEITRYMDKLGLEVQVPRGPAGLRRATRSRSRKMVLVGKLNSEIVQRLNRHGAAGGRARRARTGRCSRSSPAPNADQVGFVG